MRRLVLALTAVALAACSPGRGATCSDTVLCSDPYVCVTTGSVRRCLLPCARDRGRTDTGATIMEGDLCADGSICRASDAGLVCYFVGRIPLGDPCPSTTCDATNMVCDCEPGTNCHGGFCRQTCNIAMQDVGMPDAPDTGPFDAANETDANLDGGADGGSLYDRICGVHAICTAGVCLPFDAGAP